MYISVDMTVNQQENQDNVDIEKHTTYKTSGSDGQDPHQIMTVSNDQYSATIHLHNMFDTGFSVFQDQDDPQKEQVDEWVNVRGEVIHVDDDIDHDKIQEKGVIGYEMYGEKDTIKYTLWNSVDFEGFEEGEEYQIDSTVINEFNDQKYLSINSNTEMQEVTDEYEQFVKSAKNTAEEVADIPTTIRL